MVSEGEVLVGALKDEFIEDKSISIPFQRAKKSQHLFRYTILKDSNIVGTVKTCEKLKRDNTKKCEVPESNQLSFSGRYHNLWSCLGLIPETTINDSASAMNVSRSQERLMEDRRGGRCRCHSKSESKGLKPDRNGNIRHFPHKQLVAARKYATNVNVYLDEWVCCNKIKVKQEGEVVRLKIDLTPGNIVDRCPGTGEPIKKSKKIHHKCDLCGNIFDEFEQLLNHLTMKNLMSVVNKLITSRFPGFWVAERKRSGFDHICGECGQRVSAVGRAALQRHLGVKHNLLWDIYIREVNRRDAGTSNELM
jgi:hypothetical protein